MIRIVIENDYFKLESSDSYLLFQAGEILKENLRYRVPSAEWSAKFKEGKWDGYISLYHKSLRRSPAGLAGRAYKTLKREKIPCQIVDNRVKPEQDKNFSVDFQGKELRYYQNDAIDLALESTRGILGLATGAGKTILSCKLMSDIGSGPILFIVPSVALLKQTSKEFKAYIKENNLPIDVGHIGGGECKIIPDGINISTYHSALGALNFSFDQKKNKMVVNEKAGDKVKETLEDLIIKAKTISAQITVAQDKQKKKLQTSLKEVEYKIERKNQFKENKLKIKQLIESTKVLIIDEAHIAAEIIECISLNAKSAYYKFGLSATPSRSDNQDIRMQGAMGKVLISIKPSQLIREGHLVKPLIFTLALKEAFGGANYPEEYSLNIINNPERNHRIKQIAETFKAKNEPVLILVERLDHGKILEKMINDAVFVPGTDDSDDPIDDSELDYRASMLKKAERNEIILIATQWANTGIDVPAISTLILAGSVSQENIVLQQIGRVLRKSPNKELAFVFDFISKQSSFKQAFNSRKCIYENEEEFEVIKIE